MRATADVHQKNMEGVQDTKVKGHLQENGNFIFWWLDGPIRKMVMTSYHGTAIKDGYLAATQLWDNPKTWYSNGNGFYYINNFQPRQGK